MSTRAMPRMARQGAAEKCVEASDCLGTASQAWSPWWAAWGLPHPQAPWPERQAHTPPAPAPPLPRMFPLSEALAKSQLFSWAEESVCEERKEAVAAAGDALWTVQDFDTILASVCLHFDMMSSQEHKE